MKYGSSPPPWPSHRHCTPHSGKLIRLPCVAANAGQPVQSPALVRMWFHELTWSVDGKAHEVS